MEDNLMEPMVMDRRIVVVQVVVVILRLVQVVEARVRELPDKEIMEEELVMVVVVEQVRSKEHPHPEVVMAETASNAP